MMTQSIKYRRACDQEGHHHIAEHEENHRVVIINAMQTERGEPRREAAQCSQHQHRGAREGKGDGEQENPVFIAPVFHQHKKGNKQMKY